MLETQIAYIAGLLDGEGSIGLYLKNGRKDFSLRVAIYNTDETVINWLLLTAGGLRHKVGRHNPKHKQEYCWYLSGQKSCDFLLIVLPYLIIKQTKARIAIEAWNQRDPTPRNERRLAISISRILKRDEYIQTFKQN